jgi:hypothetical protein
MESNSKSEETLVKMVMAEDVSHQVVGSIIDAQLFSNSFKGVHGGGEKIMGISYFCVLLHLL